MSYFYIKFVTQSIARLNGDSRGPIGKRNYKPCWQITNAGA